MTDRRIFIFEGSQVSWCWHFGLTLWSPWGRAADRSFYWSSCAVLTRVHAGVMVQCRQLKPVTPVSQFNVPLDALTSSSPSLILYNDDKFVTWQWHKTRLYLKSYKTENCRCFWLWSRKCMSPLCWTNAAVTDDRASYNKRLSDFYRKISDGNYVSNILLL